jgi:hypothetical protein
MTYRQRQIDTVTAKEFADAVTQGQRPVTLQANRWAVVGNLDGRITFGDVAISILILAAGIVAGLSMAGIIWLSNLFREPNVGTATDWLLNLSRLGVYLFIIRIVVDALDLQGWTEAIFGGMWAWLEERDNEPEIREVIRPVPVSGKGASLTPAVQVVELPNGREIDFDLLAEFLRSAVRTGGTFWSREHWCNKPDDPERPGTAAMVPSQWRGIKKLCEQHHNWRSVDESAMESFIAELKGRAEWVA